MVSSSFILSDVTVVNASAILPGVSLLIDQGKIVGIEQECSRFPEDLPRYTFSEPVYALPGLIDMHVHGANGADVMDATPEALDTMARALLRQGTTGFLATTMTADDEDIAAALCNVADYQAAGHHTGAEILGVHLEGPFLYPKAAGAQNAHYMKAPDMELLHQWQRLASDVIRCVTLAPEYAGSIDFIRDCVAAQIIVGLGHTQADAACVQQALDAGASYATHLFNAMSGLHHRDAGAAYPLLLSEQVTAELIADGFHVSAWAARLAWRMKHAERLVLVSDAMRARCLGAGQYELGEQKVYVDDKGRATLANGTLAGSVLDQLSAARWMRQAVGCDLSEIVRMCSTNPAKLLNVADRKGTIAVGMDADIVLLNHDLSWINTVCRGRLLDEIAQLAELN